MSSVNTLDRLVRKNKAAKVKQLSDIAALFENKSRVDAQLLEINQLETELVAQTELNLAATKKLPKEFFSREEVKRNELLTTLSRCREEIVCQGEKINKEQELRIEELKRIDARIDMITEKTRYELSVNNLSREILDLEDSLPNA